MHELPPLRPDTPEYAFSRRAKRDALLQNLEQQYGPHFSDSDVRLYRKQRELNAARQRPSRRGGFPLDDSLPAPDTFLKLSLDFQRTILNERCEALTAVLPELPPSSAWQLYTAIPGLLTLMTLSVAQRLHGLAYATSLPLPQLLQQLLAFRRLAFVHPVTVESRLGLLARVARLDRRRAVLLMAQQPQLWLMDSRQLGPR
ncbi:hypothetical protein OEZ85_008082 [Tetradesmus obliquus]|uniref:Uncharacterized protein n=1 Tax=Tetradesmus obliquus TaxID=3088 RepID=A0ABY8TI42_TETOB|nr:hypothetical protein OEZ85_008082 [Tetradesmus obliquus]